jgi:hypothetical protein
MARKIKAKLPPLSYLRYYFPIPKLLRQTQFQQRGPWKSRTGRILPDNRLQIMKNTLQARMVSEQRRIEDLPKLALTIQEQRKLLQSDPSHYSPSQYEGLDIALNIFNFGLQVHMRNARMLNRYLKDFMQEELSQLQKVLKENPNQGRIAREILQNRIARTLVRLAMLEKIELRRIQRKSGRVKVLRIPSKRIRKYSTPPGPTDLADLIKYKHKKYLTWYTANGSNSVSRKHFRYQPD